MDLTTVWSRIETLVEAIRPYIDAVSPDSFTPTSLFLQVEEGSQEDYSAASQEITRSIGRSFSLASHQTPLRGIGDRAVG